MLAEAGSSDEDLVFHIRKSEWERPVCDQATQASDYPRSWAAVSKTSPKFPRG